MPANLVGLELTEKTLPKGSELQVSLFGPGYGECVAVHFGEGRWFIVDSCVEDRGKRPVVLEYLERIGVAPSKAV